MAKARGNAAELAFEAVMTANGFSLRRSTQEEDYLHHFDFHCGAERIDCKAVKRIYGREQDELIFVETRNYGRPGWLYAPMLTHIAFQMLDGSFLVISKTKLQEICQPFITKTAGRRSSSMQQVIDGTHAYGRLDRDEAVHLIPSSIIEQHAVRYK